MADFAAPSFSLGLDLDFDLPVGGAVGGDPVPGRPHPNLTAGESTCVSEAEVQIREADKEEDDDDMGFNPPRPPDLVPVFKRLKKGPPSIPRSAPPAVSRTRGSDSKNQGRKAFSSIEPPNADAFNSIEKPNADDDIEEFSSQEDCRMTDTFSVRKNPSTCSSSKISLHGCKILTSQSSIKADVVSSNTVSNSPLTQNLETSINKKMLPKLTVSPLRKIQFLDSDSDDASPPHEHHGIKKTGVSYNGGFSGSSHPTTLPKNVNSVELGKRSADCLWKDYLATDNASVATPALDEFCKEYFSSSISKKSRQTSSGVCFPDNSSNGSEGYLNKQASTSEEQHWNHSDPQPPSHQYFFHKDSRIRELVRVRLCNFVPLGGPLQQGSQKFDADTLDYMCQFGPKVAPNQISTGTRKTPAKTSRNRKTKTNGNAGEPSSSSNWVDPRNSMDYPKDAGKRRVCVDSHTSGHWYTGSDGKKVYVTKNGQELSGRAAYMHYRKESGGRFRKTKKKAAAKKTKAKR